MFQRIMLAWDGSEAARDAFEAAVDIARRYEAELVAVSIAYSPEHAETTADRQESVDGARRHLEASFEEIVDRADRAGVEVQDLFRGARTPVVIVGENARR
jgi:nucleotide-binding universal stress UspA family protein